MMKSNTWSTHIRYNGHNLQQAEELNPGSTVSKAVNVCTSESKTYVKVQCAYEVIVVIKPEPMKASNRMEDKTQVTLHSL